MHRNGDVNVALARGAEWFGGHGPASGGIVDLGRCELAGAVGSAGEEHATALEPCGREVSARDGHVAGWNDAVLGGVVEVDGVEGFAAFEAASDQDAALVQDGDGVAGPR